MDAISTAQPQHVVRFLFPIQCPVRPAPPDSSAPPMSAAVRRTVEALMLCANQVRSHRPCAAPCKFASAREWDPNAQERGAQRENAAPFSEPTPSKVEKRKRQRDEAVVIDLTHLPVRAARKRLVGTFVRRRLTEYSLLTRPRRFPSG